MRELTTEEITEITLYWGTWKDGVTIVDTPIFMTDDIILAQDMAMSKTNDGTAHEFGYVYTVKLERAIVQRPNQRRFILKSYAAAAITEKLTVERAEDGLTKRVSRTNI